MELVQYVFDIPGVDSFWGQRLCQDPLERFFGCQQQRGRVHDNPNAADFIKNTQVIRVIESLPHPDKGNCRGSCGDVNVFHSEPLKKRRSSGKQEPAVSANAPAAEDGRTLFVDLYNDYFVGNEMSGYTLLTAVQDIMSDSMFTVQ